MVGDKVVPIRSGVAVDPPASAVMRVAKRHDSGSTLVSPIEARRRAFHELTEAAAKAYDAASTHRAAGDLAGADLLVGAAAEAMAQAQAIGEELARL